MAQLQTEGKPYINNAWEDIKKALAKEFVKTKKTTFKLTDIQLYDKTLEEGGEVEGVGLKLRWMVKNQIIQSYTTSTKTALVNGEVKSVTVVKIEGFNYKATATSKHGNTYYVFPGLVDLDQMGLI